MDTQTKEKAKPNGKHHEKDHHEHKEGESRGKRGGNKFNRREGEADKKDHKGKRDNRRGFAPKDAPKETYFYKFHYGPYPEFEKIEVKIDTVLPERIPKEEKLHEPTKDEYIKRLQHLDESIKKNTQKIRDLNTEKKEKRGLIVRKPEGAEEGKSGEKTFPELVAEKKKLQALKKKLEDEAADYKKQINGFEKELLVLMKNCDPKVLTIHNVNKKIHALESKMETSSMSAAQQTIVIKQIDLLIKSKKYVEKVQKIEPEKEKLYKKMKEIEKEAKVHRQEIFKLNQILDKLSEENKKRKDMSEENKGELDLLEDKIQEVKKEIQELDVKKDEFREDFYKRKYEYEVQKMKLGYIEGLYRQQNELKKEQAEKARIEEEKKSEREGMPNPNQEDIETADFLIRLLNKLARDFEKKQNADNKNEERKEESAKIAEEYKKQAEAGKIMIVKPKHLREKEEMLVIGGKPKGKKGRKGGKKQNAEVAKQDETKADESKADEVKVDEVLDQLLYKFKITPPETHGAIPKIVEELEAIKTDLFTKGEQELDKILKGQLETEQTPEEESVSKKAKKQQKLQYKPEEEEESQNWPSLA